VRDITLLYALHYTLLAHCVKKHNLSHCEAYMAMLYCVYRTPINNRNWSRLCIH
jgi:hypothetical protein